MIWEFCICILIFFAMQLLIHHFQIQGWGWQQCKLGYKGKSIKGGSRKQGSTQRALYSSSVNRAPQNLRTGPVHAVWQVNWSSRDIVDIDLHVTCRFTRPKNTLLMIITWWRYTKTNLQSVFRYFHVHLWTFVYRSIVLFRSVLVCIGPYQLVMQNAMLHFHLQISQFYRFWPVVMHYHTWTDLFSFIICS